jgi:hypothetical protein
MTIEEIKKLVLSKRPTQEPSITQKASTLGRSLVKWANNGFVRVDQLVYDKRLSICRGCENWVEDGNIGFGKCKICGCGKGKLWLGHEKCPISKWTVEPLTPPPSL